MTIPVSMNPDKLCMHPFYVLSLLLLLCAFSFVFFVFPLSFLCFGLYIYVVNLLLVFFASSTTLYMLANSVSQLIIILCLGVCLVYDISIYI